MCKCSNPKPRRILRKAGYKSDNAGQQGGSSNVTEHSAPSQSEPNN